MQAEGGAHPRVGGEDWADVAVLSTWGAHPRVGGEDSIVGPSRWRAVGSPPRRRGRLVGVDRADDLTRLTPA